MLEITQERLKADFSCYLCNATARAYRMNGRLIQPTISIMKKGECMILHSEISKTSFWHGSQFTFGPDV